MRKHPCFRVAPFSVLKRRGRRSRERHSYHSPRHRGAFNLLGEAERRSFYATMLVRILALFTARSGGGAIMAHEMQKIIILTAATISQSPKPPDQPKRTNALPTRTRRKKKKPFETAYKGTESKTKGEKRSPKSQRNWLRHFGNENEASAFVAEQMGRVQRNLITRRMRLARKIHLGNWNYFARSPMTIKNTRKKASKKLELFQKLCHRKGWIYIGVWGSVPQSGNDCTSRSVLRAPNAGWSFVEHRDYSTKNHQMQMTLQNTYFNARFGRYDFSPLTDENLGEATAIWWNILKNRASVSCIPKTRPPISFRTFWTMTWFAPSEQEDKKLLLYDNFSCFDEGVYIGTVSPKRSSNAKELTIFRPAELNENAVAVKG